MENNFNLKANYIQKNIKCNILLPDSIKHSYIIT